MASSSHVHTQKLPHYIYVAFTYTSALLMQLKLSHMCRNSSSKAYRMKQSALELQILMNIQPGVIYGDVNDFVDQVTHM